MILKDILNGVSGTLLQGDLQQEINSITIDSRKTESNVLFVAIKGMKVDGHSFITVGAVPAVCGVYLAKVVKQPPAQTVDGFAVPRHRL